MTRINPYKLFVGSFIPNWLMSRSELTSSAKLVYARLAQYAGVNGHAYPKRETLAEELGLSLGMVKLGIKELKVNKLVEVIQRGLNQSNMYYFLAHEWMGLDVPDGQPASHPVGQPASHQDGQPASHIRESLEENHLREKIQPKAGPPKVLNPEIKKIADKLFKANPTRYRRLITWVKTQQRDQVPDPAIVAALAKFEPYAETAGEDWWPYLSKLAVKARQDYWAGQHDAEHESHKAPIARAGELLAKLGF